MYAWNTAILFINSLKKELKKHDNDLAIKQSTKPRIGEIKKLTRVNKMENRVYKTNCSVCPKTYIRQAGYTFDMRYKYHSLDPMIGKQRSSFAQLQHEWYKLRLLNEKLSFKSHVLFNTLLDCNATLVVSNTNAN